MFNKLFRKYNQNRKTIWIVIIAIVSFIALLQFLNNIAKQKKEEEYKKSNMLSNGVTTQNSNNLSSSGTSNNTKISSVGSDVESIINMFVDYCNNKQIEEAYNMLSEDCKQAMFPTLKDFQDTYYSRVFNKNRNVKIETSMYGSLTYKVTYFEDLLSSGGKSQDTLQDYIYLTNVDNQIKLSISQFLYSEDINKYIESNSIMLKVLKKSVYINYETYQIQIMNNTENKIAISDLKNTDTIYMLDENEIKHIANIAEIPQERLVINTNSFSIIDIKFDKIYNVENKSKSIVFEKIIKDYEGNLKGEEKQNISISIDL